MNANTYIIVPAFLRTEFELKGNELLIAALIYGYSQDGRGTYFGGVEYLCEWTGADRTTVMRALQSLTARGILRKTSVLLKGSCSKCSYEFTAAVHGSQNPTRHELQNATRIIKDNNKMIYNKDDDNKARAGAPTTATLFEKNEKKDERFLRVGDIADYLQHDCAEWLHDLCERNNYSERMVAGKITEFVTELRNAGTFTKEKSDCTAHFWNWLRKNVGAPARVNVSAPTPAPPRAHVDPEKLAAAARELQARRAELLEQYREYGDICLSSIADGLSVYSSLKAEGYVLDADAQLPTAEAIKRGFDRMIIKEGRV